MTDPQDVTATESDSARQSSEQERAIQPAVDIFEDELGITVQADMPGVSKDRVDIQIDKHSLTIEGYAEIPMPEGMEPMYADVSSTRYMRSFSISSELDADKVEAALKDGILTVRVPKREQFKPRKIEVRAG
jgi:HSP20 family protein